MEELNFFQIQLLLYFLEAEPGKRTVTDASKQLGRTKVAVTRALDKLEEKNIVERVEGRKTVLIAYGNNIAKDLENKLKAAERYMQYHDIPPAVAGQNALAMIQAGFTEEFLECMEEQEERMRIKEFFAGRKNFTGKELCEQLKDGSYTLPFIIYRENIKNGSNLSMANNGFENPCQLVVKNHVGNVYLTVRTVTAESAVSAKLMEGRVERLQYEKSHSFVDALCDGRYVHFPADVLKFVSMGNGREEVLHGSVRMKIKCSVGILHMPEGRAVFTLLLS